MRDLLRDHPALFVTGVYVIASAVGMLFSWAYLLRFGINVFHFAQIGDFLIASLREPMTWLLVAFVAVLSIADTTFARRWQKKPRSRWTRWYGTSRYRIVSYVTGLVTCALLIDAYANSRADDTLAGDGQRVRIEFAESGRHDAGILLYTTSQFLFLFDPASRRVTTHPHESVSAIIFDPVPAR